MSDHDTPQDDTSQNQGRRRLEDKDIQSGPQIGRRIVVGGALTVVGLAGAGCVPAQPIYTPPPTTGCTDSDVGSFADPAGNGRCVTNPVYTGCTDSDVGAYADAVNYGYCAGSSYTGCTDSDAGAYADAAGYGYCGGCTDSNTGAYADPAGGGRYCY